MVLFFFTAYFDYHRWPFYVSGSVNSNQVRVPKCGIAGFISPDFVGMPRRISEILSFDDVSVDAPWP